MPSGAKRDKKARVAYRPTVPQILINVFFVVSMELPSGISLRDLNSPRSNSKIDAMLEAIIIGNNRV